MNGTKDQSNINSDIDHRIEENRIQVMDKGIKHRLSKQENMEYNTELSKLRKYTLVQFATKYFRNEYVFILKLLLF